MKIALYSNDILLINRWKKILNEYEIKIIEDYEELFAIKDYLLILSDCVDLKDSSYVVKILLANLNKILVLRRIPEINNAKKWLELGVQGYGNCLMTSSYLKSAVKTIANNYVWLIPQITTELLNEMVNKEKKEIDETELFSELTKTEKTIASLLKKTYTNKKICEELKISINTVKTHIKHIYEKLDVKDRLSFIDLFNK